MRRKNADDVEAQPSATGRITPADVQQVEFRLAFRGYNERDVDAFLDRITEDLSAYLDELERARGGSPASFADPSISASGDVDAARREADAIRTRAREEAAAIVRRAHQDAAAIVAGAGGPEGDMRAAVAPVLNTEREFLQSLGTLVQDHAEEIKQMVLALRAREGAEGSSSSPAPAPAAVPPPQQPRPEDVGGASAAEMRERMGAPEPPPAPERTVTVDSGTEPAFSSEGAPAGDPRERSLRELFWGED